MNLFLRHQQLSQENAAKEILAAFKQSDTKKQGFITAQELRQILTSTGEKVTFLLILTTVDCALSNFEILVSYSQISS